MNVIIDIEKEWLKINEKKFSKAYDEQNYREPDEKGKGLIIDVNIENNEYLVSNDDKVKVSGGFDGFYISIEDKPTIGELLNLATIISKYYNKAKSAIEALK